MRVAVVVHGFPALSETFILNQITGLIDAGHDVEILAFVRGPGEGAHGDVARYGLMQRASFFGMPKPLGRRLAYAPVIAARLAARGHAGFLIRRVRPARAEVATLTLPYALAAFRRAASFDVIHCHFGPIGNVALALRQRGLLQGRLVTSFHGIDAGKYPQRWGQEVYRDLFRLGDAFTANSTFIFDRVVALGCDPDRLTRLPEGLRSSRFPFIRRTPARQGEVNFLTVGRLVPKKGIRYSIEAFKHVSGRLPGARYFVVGDGPERRDLMRLIGELGLRGRVVLTGPKRQEELVEFARDMHCFVLASVTTQDGDREGQGLVLQEAQAMGLPVVATAHNGFPDSVLEGQSGFLVPERDTHALAERMQWVAEHPDRWASMGEAGAQFVRAHFDQERLTRQLVGIYESVLANGRPAD